MPEFSSLSKARLNFCDSKLQELFNEVIKEFDCTILCGHRTKEEQDDAFKAGNSKLEWPHSKHNKMPSEAVDAAPYPIDWSDKQRFAYFAGFVMGTASRLGIKLRWGGDWTKDNDLKNDSFVDAVHFELI